MWFQNLFTKGLISECFISSVTVEAFYQFGADLVNRHEIGVKLYVKEHMIFNGSKEETQKIWLTLGITFSLCLSLCAFNRCFYSVHSQSFFPITSVWTLETVGAVVRFCSIFKRLQLWDRPWSPQSCVRVGELRLQTHYHGWKALYHKGLFLRLVIILSTIFRPDREEALLNYVIVKALWGRQKTENCSQQCDPTVYYLLKSRLFLREERAQRDKTNI